MLGVTQFLANAAGVALEQEDTTAARDYALEALGIRSEIGARVALSSLSSILAMLALRQDDFNLARFHLREYANDSFRAGAFGWGNFFLTAAAEVAARVNKPVLAATFLGARSVVPDGMLANDPPLLARSNAYSTEAARATLGVAEFEKAFDAGKRLSREEAFQLAAEI